MEMESGQQVTLKTAVKTAMTKVVVENKLGSLDDSRIGARSLVLRRSLMSIRRCRVVLQWSCNGRQH